MAIATQEVFAHDDARVETWGLGAATPKLTLVQQASSLRYGVSLTDTTGVARTDLDIDLGAGIKVSGFKAAGVGNADASAVGTFAAGVAIDGTWEFESVAGAVIGTPQGTIVYATPAGVVTLTATSNTRIGVVNYPALYNKVAGTLPVKIGA